MIHRMLRYGAGWEWHVLRLEAEQTAAQQTLPSRRAPGGRTNAERGGPHDGQAARQDDEPLHNERQIMELKRQFPHCSHWVEESRIRRANHISVDWLEEVGPLLSGTLMMQVSDDETDIQPFHFWVTQKLLITMHHDLRLPLRLQNGAHTVKYGDCTGAPEAFFIMIGALLETFHTGLDGFERRLGELERAMRRSNRTGLLDTIFERRFDLLHWSHLFIPIREVHGAAREAFMNELEGQDAFVRITHKLERIETLLKHYALEIDTLISMDDAISGFRGNDIMKTLTIFTVMFLPASIVGALWGVNFEWLPWKRHQWGFPVMMAGIVIITLGIYMWLWRKGWTGDLLHKRRKATGIAADASSERGSRVERYGRGRRTEDPSRADTAHEETQSLSAYMERSFAKRNSPLQRSSSSTMHNSLAAHIAAVPEQPSTADAQAISDKLTRSRRRRM